MKLEINSNCKDAEPLKIAKTTIMITPPINEDYWVFRVAVSENQAIVGFEKFFTIGIGFQHEEDWNTNLPYQSSAQEILDHISHNKGDNSIPDKTCLEAIQLVQDAATKYMELKKE
jgi:hypothetical protein